MTRLGIYKSIDEQSLLLPPTAENGELASADWHEEALRFGRQSLCHYLFMMTTVDFISVYPFIIFFADFSRALYLKLKGPRVCKLF
jgi:hypothetical protein